jgi:hypothetical protein
VTIVGVSVWENDQARVEPFVNAQANRMNYAVAMDDVPKLPDDVKSGTRSAQAFAFKNGRMSQSWLIPANQNGVPAAFIINQEGQIAWIGNPLAGIDEPLARALAGT